MSSPRSRQLFKSTAIGFLERREADGIERKELPRKQARKGPAGTEEKASDL